ncbi:MAG: hypothetical protein KJ063_01735 [Anaerolineae bacterium]|nr:hypothetical protein [Anaerolineae bacterium]
MKQRTILIFSLGAGLIALTLIRFMTAAQPGFISMTLTPEAYLPFIIKMPTPTPTPTQAPSQVEAWLGITPTGGINASTFGPGSFVLTNRHHSGHRLTQLVIDLRTSALPDIVFDPYGLAGDLLAKDLEIDSDPDIVGFAGHNYSSPNDGGYDVLHIYFHHLDPGESVAFSVDIDPLSIQGVPAPGPNETGSISGLEMAGATVTAHFANGLIITGQLYRIPNSDSGSEVTLRENLPAMPPSQIVGLTPPVVVTNSAQNVQISGLANQPVRVLILEGGLFTQGLPGGGHNIDPFEANSIILVQEHIGQLDGAGQLTVPIVLTKSDPDGGINHILVVLEDWQGIRGRVAGPFVVELSP